MITTAKEKIQKALEAKAKLLVKLAVDALFLNQGWVPNGDDEKYFIVFDPERVNDPETRKGFLVDVEEYNDVPLFQIFFKTESQAQAVLDSLTDEELQTAFMNTFEGVTVQGDKAYLTVDAETIGYCAHALIDQKGTVTSNDVVDALREAGYWATHAFVDPTLYNYAVSKGWVIVRSKGYNEYMLKMPQNAVTMQSLSNATNIDILVMLDALLGGKRILF